MEEKVKDEEKFKEQVKDYFKGKEMTFWDKREVKKWLKNVEKYMKILEETIKKVKEEYEYIIKKQEEKGFKVEKELNYMKKEIIDRIMDTKEILIIEDPNTKMEATKESLMKCDVNQLINLLEENVKILKETVEGKIERS